MPITPEEAELRPPPADQIWMETEEIGLGDGWLWSFIAGFVVMLTLAIVLPLVLL
jgi:hypothetical protein